MQRNPHVNDRLSFYKSSDIGRWLRVPKLKVRENLLSSLHSLAISHEGGLSMRLFPQPYIEGLRNYKNLGSAPVTAALATRFAAEPEARELMDYSETLFRLKFDDALGRSTGIEERLITIGAMERLLGISGTTAKKWCAAAAARRSDAELSPIPAACLTEQDLLSMCQWRRPGNIESQSPAVE